MMIQKECDDYRDALTVLTLAFVSGMQAARVMNPDPEAEKIMFELLAKVQQEILGKDLGLELCPTCRGKGLATGCDECSGRGFVINTEESPVH